MVRTVVAWLALLAAVPVAAQDNATAADVQDRFARAEAALKSRDFATAAPLLVGLCEEGISTTCSFAGRVLANGDGVARDVPKALVLFDRGCSAQISENCRFAARLLEESPAIERDVEKATDYISLACTMKDAVACASFGDRQRLGTGVERDWASALQAYEIACEMDNGHGCRGVGSIYSGDLYPKDGDPQRDYTKSAEAFRKACDLDDGIGCAFFADRLETGRGVEEDRAAALAIYRKAEAMELEQWARNSVEGRIAELSAELGETTAEQ